MAETDSMMGVLPERRPKDPMQGKLRRLANRRPELYEEDEYTSAEYESMMEMYQGSMASIDEGEIVKAKVQSIRENVVVLDIGFKSEGTVPLEEFKDHPDLKVGDEVEVLLEHLEDQEGAVVLSKKKADFMRVWEKIRVAYETDQPVEGTLVKKIKGGVVVDLMGVDAFLPGSQIALRRVPNIDELLGQKFEFKIIKLNKRRRNIVVSRRVILENERAGKREKLDAQRAPTVEAREHRRDDRSGRSQGRSERREDLAGHEADGAGSVDGVAAQVPGRHAHQREGSEPHVVRRVRRDRAGHRWS